VKANELLENAGSKILVKIGDIIGPQTEMYQEKTRQFPMQVAYTHTLERNIEFTVPDGYIVKNPGDLAIDDVYKENGEVTMASPLRIRPKAIPSGSSHGAIPEDLLSLAEYENFKKVINASADFNKSC